MAKYANDLYLADLSNVSKSIYQSGLEYKEKVYKGRKGKRPIDLIKLFFLTYLTGGRIGEMIQAPYPKLSQIGLKEWTIMHIDKLNEKHFINKIYKLVEGEFTNKGKPRRKVDMSISKKEVMSQNIPIDDPYEKLMWDFITDGGLNLNCKAFLEKFGGYKNRNAITNRFKYNFFANLTDGNETFLMHPMNPHQLRHLRTYSLLINKGYEDSFIQAFYGWSSKRMMEHYVYIKKAVKDKEQMQILERHLQRAALTGGNTYKLG